MQTISGHVLVVDDEELLGRVMARRLRSRGLDADTCTGGEEALRLLLAPDAPWDVVLLDVVMPDLSGLTVLSRLRAVRSAIDLPVIMLTSRSDAETVVTALEAGANDYVTKPAQMSVLMARIGAQLERRQASRALRESEERYAVAAAGSRDVLWDWSVESDELYLSPRWDRLVQSSSTGMEPGLARLLARIHPGDQERVRDALGAHLRGATEHLEVELRLLRDDGATIWALLRGSAVKTPRGTRVAGSLTDLSSPALHDPVTGLPNRVAFLQHLGATIKTARGEGVAVFVIALRRAVTVEQTLGSQAGAALLDLAASRMGDLLADGSAENLDTLVNMTLARLDGAEFAVVLNGCPDAATALRTGRWLLDRAQRPYLIDGHDVRVGAAVGVAMCTSSLDSPDQLMSWARSAVGRAATEPDRVALYDPDAQRSAVRRLKLEAELAAAIAKDGLRIEYQPIVDLETTEIVAVEALARWDHPTRGPISPAEFVPIAEAADLAGPLGAWVLRTATARVASWRNPSGRPIRLAVNVSPLQFETDLPALVARTLRDTGFSADRLELELTEGVFAHDAARVASVLGQLRKLGVRVALDDFGTGYSSLSYLAQFPIDTLKLDRSFVRQLPGGRRAGVITRATLAMASELGLHVVAEGIEEPGTAEYLRTLDCALAQGFYFHRPARPEHLEGSELVDTEDRAS